MRQRQMKRPSVTAVGAARRPNFAGPLDRSVDRRTVDVRMEQLPQLRGVLLARTVKVDEVCLLPGRQLRLAPSELANCSGNGEPSRVRIVMRSDLTRIPRPSPGR